MSESGSAAQKQNELSIRGGDRILDLNDVHVASRWKQYSAPPASAMSFTHYWDCVVKLNSRLNASERAFSGCETIIWQSMNIPGTPLDTQDRTGAPVSLKLDKSWLHPHVLDRKDSHPW